MGAWSKLASAAGKALTVSCNICHVCNMCNVCSVGRGGRTHSQLVASMAWSSEELRPMAVAARPAIETDM